MNESQPFFLFSSEYKIVSIFKESSLDLAAIFPSFLTVHFLFFNKRHSPPGLLTPCSLPCLEAPSVTFQILLWDFPSSMAFSGCSVSMTSLEHAVLLTARSGKYPLPSCAFLIFPSAFPLLMSFSSVVVSQTVWCCFPPLFFCVCPFFAISQLLGCSLTLAIISVCMITK